MQTVSLFVALLSLVVAFFNMRAEARQNLAGAVNNFITKSDDILDKLWSQFYENLKNIVRPYSILRSNALKVAKKCGGFIMMVACALCSLFCLGSIIYYLSLFPLQTLMAPVLILLVGVFIQAFGAFFFGSQGLSCFYDVVGIETKSDLEKQS